MDSANAMPPDGLTSSQYDEEAPNRPCERLEYLQSRCGASLQFPVPLICPACQSGLRRQGQAIQCLGAPASHRYGFQQGFPDLIVGERFDDPTSEEAMAYEEVCNEFTARSYWIPLFRSFWPAGRPARVLAMGCGVGKEVDELCQAGFVCVGIDNGNRSKVWSRRTHGQSLLLANGLHLPFEDSTFDGAFCGCVFPHVGVVGDSFKLNAHYYQDRLALAREMTRVVRKGGKIVLSSPNRLFPFDIFHGRKPGSYKPRLNRPGDRFLLSAGDYWRLFAEAGCSFCQLQPVRGYWGFHRSRQTLKGRMLGVLARALLWTVSQEPLSFLRASPLTPWIVTAVTK